MKKLFVFVYLFTATAAFSQYGNKDGNRIGLVVGVSQLSLETTNFKANSELGFNAGFQVRGNYYNNFSAIFGVQYFENSFSVPTIQALTSIKEDLKYKLMGAQIRILGSYNIVKDHVSIDLGPVLQLNSDFKINKQAETNEIVGTNLDGIHILKANRFNFNGYVGISGGTRRVRLILSYQHGFSNLLNKNNDVAANVLANGGKKFNGNLSLLSAQLLFNL